MSISVIERSFIVGAKVKLEGDKKIVNDFVSNLLSYYSKVDKIQYERELYNKYWLSFEVGKAFIADESFNVFSGNDFLIAQDFNGTLSPGDDIYLPRKAENGFSSKEYQRVVDKGSTYQNDKDRIDRYLKENNYFNRKIDDNILCSHLFSSSVRYIKMDTSMYAFPVTSLVFSEELEQACIMVGIEEIRHLMINRKVVLNNNLDISEVCISNEDGIGKMTIG